MPPETPFSGAAQIHLAVGKNIQEASSIKKMLHEQLPNLLLSV